MLQCWPPNSKLYFYFILVLNCFLGNLCQHINWWLNVYSFDNEAINKYDLIWFAEFILGSFTVLVCRYITQFDVPFLKHCLHLSWISILNNCAYPILLKYLRTLQSITMVGTICSEKGALFPFNGLILIMDNNTPTFIILF